MKITLKENGEIIIDGEKSTALFRKLDDTDSIILIDETKEKKFKISEIDNLYFDFETLDSFLTDKFKL